MFCVLVVDSLLLLNSKYSVMWINCSCFIYSAVGCLQVGLIISEAVVSTLVYLFVDIGFHFSQVNS